ncbi:MAG: hypothetical protein GOVbin4933_21 [Prokaryotic dsDNA virus sp.]|nr:MAG: hypothetical protein GOVbin4933_21 [Prokaryotic dsDNA virus sp.]
METKTIRATFHVPITTDRSHFQRCLRAIYEGTAEDEDVQFVLENTQGITCGHRSEVQADKAKR